MTKEGIVTRILPHSMAEVAVTRSTACGGNCGSCEACQFQNELKAVADNSLGAKPGQKVIIETRSSLIFRAAILVYIVPLIFFIVGYIIAFSLGADEGICVLVSFVFLIMSGALLVLSQRRNKNKKTIDFQITEIL